MITRVKILDHIEGAMINLGLTRAKTAEKMNAYDDRSQEWSKEKLDKLFQNPHCPRAETLSELKRAVGVADFPPIFYRSKNGGDSD